MAFTPAKIDGDYPAAIELLPPTCLASGGYSARFAQSVAELDEVLRLRYEVFNLELNEGLDTSHESGRDVDVYDAGYHHLLIRHRGSGKVVGTYRLQTAEMARAHAGFYSADEFDFAMLSKRFLADSVELGRACVHRDHRSGRVLYLLWKGLVHYLRSNGKRYFFGCSSLTSQDPHLAKRVMEHLAAHGHLHDSIQIRPLPRFRCYEDDFIARDDVEPKIPRLMRLYLSYGVQACGPPAIDRLFKTIDYFTVFDLRKADARFRKLFF